MRSLRLLALFTLGALAELAASARPHPSLPPIGSLDGLGVNIHFTDAQPGELEMIAAAGFRWVRMDLSWAATERERGRYDFSAFERLSAALEAQKLRALFILDYGNPLYDSGAPPRSEEARAAFARWAVAALRHFRGKGYLWELWNEPNHAQFWKPRPNAQEYIALARTTGETLRAAGLVPKKPGEPGECFLGPATSTIDFAFLEACFQAGLLEYWDAVSVHPYRQTAPETAEDEYRKLRLLLRRHAPAGKTIPILSGEWGYSTAWPSLGQDEPAREQKQALYLARQLLTNLANDIPLTIWYDWRDDGDNPKESEHRFGIVRRPWQKDAQPPFAPKPAYLAARFLTEHLAGFRFNKRLLVEDNQRREQERTRLLLFSRDETERLVAYHDGGPLEEDEETRIPASRGKFHTFRLGDGPAGTVREAGKEGLITKTRDLDLTILTPEKRNDFLRVAAASPRLPLEFVYAWPGSALKPIPARARPAGLHEQASSTSGGRMEKSGLVFGFFNPLDRPIHRSFGHRGVMAIPSGEQVPERHGVEPYSRAPQRRHTFSYNLQIDPDQTLWYAQATTLICTNPLLLEAWPPRHEELPVRISNPSGEPLLGVITIETAPLDSARTAPTPVELRLAAGETEKLVRLPFRPVSTPAEATLEIHQDFEAEEVKGVNLPVLRQELPASSPLPPLRKESFRVAPDGDAKVDSSHSLDDHLPDAGPPISDDLAMRLTYRFAAGWKFLRLVPLAEAIPPVETDAGTVWPRGLGLFVHGDASGCTPRLRFTDATGQTFQASGPKIDWKGWRYITLPMHDRPGSKIAAAEPLSSWGGKNDGQIHYPIKWDTLFLLDNGARNPISGALHLSAPTLLY